MNREISIEEHIKELASYIGIPILINRESYKKLVEIANNLKKTNEETLEGLIDLLYDHLKEEGEI